MKIMLLKVLTFTEDRVSEVLGVRQGDEDKDEDEDEEVLTLRQDEDEDEEVLTLRQDEDEDDDQ